MSALTAETAGLVQQWLQVDPEESSRAAVQELARDENESKLKEILGTRLAFGEPV